MLEKFKTFITDKKLFSQTDKILLTVSGGIDSVVMAHLFAEAKFDFGIAHCNFQLRAEESDKDELFVKILAEKFKVPFFVKRFETKKFADLNKISIQMAARELRYEFFESILKENNFSLLATAHHAGDSTETILLNLVRGSGIAAYHGIKIKNEKIIRPLLFASRNEIEIYAKEKNILWREDASNNSDDYMRNKIRHHVIPTVKEINPSLDETMMLHTQHMQDVELIYQTFIQNVKEKIMQKEKDEVKFSIAELLSYPSPKTILFELLKEFGFTRHHADDIFLSLQETEVKLFYSGNFELIKERNLIFVRTKNQTKTISFAIEGHGEFELPNLTLNISEKIKNGILSEKTTSASIEYFDADKILFPLIIRNWSNGDFFYPLGMKGKKLLSDFFTDEKFSHQEKEKQLLLMTKNDVLWVLGKRMDDRFKITPQTKRILQITIHDKR